MLRFARHGEWEWQAASGTLLLSAKGRQLFGLPADTPLTHETIRERIHPEDRARHWAAVKRGLRTGVFSSEHRICLPDGHIRWLESRGELLNEAGSNERRMLGVVYDITARKDRDHALARSQERMRLVLSTTAAIAWSTDADGAFVAPQESWEAYTGQPWTGHAQWGWIEALHPDDRRRFEHQWRHAVQRGVSFAAEGRIWHAASAAYRHFEARAAPMTKGRGRVREWIGTFSDVHDRVVAMARLHESQARLRRLADANIVGVIQWNLASSLIIDCNDEFLRMTGYDRDDLLAGRLNFEAMTPPEWQRRNLRGIEEIRSQGAASAYEKEYIRKDGSRLPVIIAGARYADSSEEGMSFVLDLTDRKRAEDDLRNSEVRFRTLADSIPQLAWMARPDGHIFWYNRRWYEYTGTTLEEVQGWGWTKVHDPAELPRVVRKISRNFATGEPWEDTFPLRRHDGAMRSHLSRMLPVRDDQGKIVMWFGTNTDVTEHEESGRRQARIAEIALKVGTSLSHSGSIVETLQMLVEAARGILGARCARIGTTLARSPAQPLHLLAFEHPGFEWPEALQEWETSACSIVEMSNRPVRQPHSIPGRDGASDRAGASVPPPKASWLGVPLVGNDGRNLGVLQFLDKSDHGDFSVEDEAIGVQVATMAAVALETWRLVQALKQADRQKDAFLATLAHELRNPLAPLRNGLEIIRKAPAGSDVSRTREMMDRQLRQMVRLIDDLLDLARITQGKIDLRRERIEISAVVQLALESCMTAIEQADHRLHVAQTPDRIFVDVDVTRFAQVFANLLNNAAKFTPPGGEIHVAIGRDGEDAFVSVKDTGVGIPENMLASVFDMFTQVERTLDRTHGGLGIGLYLVRRLTEMHGGSVAARSAGPDQGSEFVIRVPVLLSLVPDSHAPAPVDHPSSPGRRRILIADDNADAAESLAMLLQMQGDDVRTVRDGIEALKLGESFRPHVVLLDIGMPRLNGIDTARRARDTDWGRDALLVAITGWGQPGDRERSEAAGFDLHLVKPVDIDALLDGIANDKRNSGG